MVRRPARPACSSCFLLVGAVNLATGGGLLFRKLYGFLVATIPLLVVLGLVRAVALLRRSTGASWRDALGAFLIWQSTSLVTARASVQALFAEEAEFLRTPKTAEDATFWDAVKGNRGETVLGVLGLAGIAASLTHPVGLAGPLTAMLLVWPTISYLSAPLNSLAAQRAALPPELRARRSTEFQRSGSARRVTFAAGGAAVAGVAVAGVVALLAPGNVAVDHPRVIGPLRGSESGSAGPTATPSPTASRSPSGSPTTPSPTSSSATTTSSPSPSSSPSATASTPSATASPTGPASTPAALGGTG